MNYYDELQKLREIKKQCLSEIQGIEDAKNAELDRIEKAKKQAVLKYAELSKSKQQELGEYNNRTDSYCRLIESYSYFQAKNIGNSIASLIGIFEGKNYIYQEAEYYTTKTEVLAFDKLVTKVIEHLIIVIAEDNRRSWYSDDKNEDLNIIIENGLAIILSNDIDDIEIPFYRANNDSHTLEQCVKFGRFSYVKDFIDVLISYKIEHGLKDISYDEIERLKVDFISSRFEQIEENYKLLTCQEEEKIIVDKENRQLLLKSVLDKNKK